MASTFLPVSKQDLVDRGIEQLDFVFVEHADEVLELVFPHTESERNAVTPSEKADSPTAESRER
mgnify:CR=1 FL=1